jgi:hypothetical protein
MDIPGIEPRLHGKKPAAISVGYGMAEHYLYNSTCFQQAFLFIKLHRLELFFMINFYFHKHETWEIQNDSD